MRSIQLAAVAALSLMLLPAAGQAQSIRIGPGGVELIPEPERRVAPPPRAIVRDELRERLFRFREECEDGDRRACIRFGMILGENRERQEEWRREHPEVFFFER